MVVQKMKNICSGSIITTAWRMIERQRQGVPSQPADYCEPSVCVATADGYLPRN